MGKVIFYSMVVLGLVACGGGGGTAGAAGGGAAGGAAAADDAANNNVYPAPTISSGTKKDYLDEINNRRIVARDCGRYVLDANGKCIKDINGNCKKIYDRTDWRPAVNPLGWDDSLYAAAAEHSFDLATWNHGVTTDTEARKRFQHEGSGTNSDWTAQKLHLGRGSTVKERITNNEYHKISIGENISAGTNRDTVVEAVDSWIASPPHCKNLMYADYTKVGMAMYQDSNSYYIHYWTQDFGGN